jgi:hypothetical protein
MIRPLLSLFLSGLVTFRAFGAPNETAPKTGVNIPLTDASRFGPPQAQGEQTEEMKQLLQAGIYEGQKSSITFLRWKGANPPVVFQVGLWGPQITNEHAALLPSLSEIEALSFYETSVDDSAVPAIAKLPNLRTLAFAPVDRYQKTGFTRMQWSYPWLPKLENRPRLTGKALSVLSTIPSLDTLDLRDTHVDSASLEALGRFPKLADLGLPHPIDAEAIRHLQACKHLGALILGGREIRSSEIERLAALPSLKRLTLRNARIPNETLAALAKLEKLTTLSIYDCGLTDAQLAHLGKPPALNRLDLVRNVIEGHGLSALAPFALKKLDLTFNNLSDASLSRLPALDTLEELSLAYCVSVSDGGIRSGILQKMTHLQMLELRGLTKVTDASLEELSQFGHLKLIGIREANVSWQSVDQMRAAMPATKVFK